jgi:transposase-like protein
LILPRARVKHQRLSDEQRAEILQLVAKSPLPVSQTLATLGIPRFTYYHWRGPQRRRAAGTPPEEPPPRRCAWNRLRDWEVAKVLEYAHRDPDIASRELACKLTDEAGFSVSESTVYRILKRHNLLPTAPILLAAAANEYHRKTTCVNELWQTDLTYFHVVGWGWYFVGGVLDDYSRYLIVGPQRYLDSSSSELRCTWLVGKGSSGLPGPRARLCCRRNAKVRRLTSLLLLRISSPRPK